MYFLINTNVLQRNERFEMNIDEAMNENEKKKRKFYLAVCKVVQRYVSWYFSRCKKGNNPLKVHEKGKNNENTNYI